MIKLKSTIWILLLIIMLGLVLRINNLGTESFWYDEIGSIANSTIDLSTIFFRFQHAPVYFFFLRCWMKLVPTSEFWLRFPSVIFGVGSILLLYKLGKILFNKTVGLISSFLLSLSPFHLFYSQEVRHYSLFVFLTLLSMFFIIKIAKKQFIADSKLYIYYALATVLLLFTHHFAIFVVFSQNLLFLLQKVKQKKKWIFTQAIMLLVYLTWFASYLTFFFQENEYLILGFSWIAKPTPLSFINIFRVFAYGGPDYGGSSFFVDPKLLSISPLLLYLLGAFLIWGMMSFSKKNSATLLFLVSWLFIPPLTMFILSYVFLPLFVERFFIFALPAYYLLVAKGINAVRNSLCKASIPLLIAVFVWPALHFYYVEDIKIRWNKAIDYIEANKKESNIILVSLTRHAQMFEYLRIKNNDRNKPLNCRMEQELKARIYKGNFLYKIEGYDIIGIKAEQLKHFFEKEGIIKKGDSFWLVLSRWEPGPQRFTSYLESFCYAKKDRHYAGVDVIEYIVVENPF